MDNVDGKLRLPVSKGEFDSVVSDALLDDFINRISKIVVKVAEKDILKLHNRDFRIINKTYLMPKKDLFIKENNRDSDYSVFENWKNGLNLPKEINFELPTLTELKNEFNSLLDGTVNVLYLYTTGQNIKWYSKYNGNTCEYVYVNSYYEIGKALPYARLPDFTTNVDFIVNSLFKYDFVPALGEEAINDFEDLHILYEAGYVYVEDGEFAFNTEKLMEDLINEQDTETLGKLHLRLVELVREAYDKKILAGGSVETIKEKLLNCEKLRADIDPYEERILTDPNRGHWDLYDDNAEEGYHIAIDADWIARNPKDDINEDGVIAIDFGTKSTVVVYQSDIEHSLPMGIGDGEISKSPTPKRYENPTIMEFVNLQNFLNAYGEKDGRPATLWEDLRVSHAALDQFTNSKSEEYYAFLHQIKQWAGEAKKQFRLKTRSGETYMLPAFEDLKEGDFNPIELYAYYIGLYINNMRKGHGIYLDYYLSFPVTYEKKIREKITESFERGLKKSLPESILHDEEIMKKFRVHGNISEPAAYAVCALQEYGFAPKEDEEIFYSIFDFGGGTTDFDFGLWTKSKKRRYDYTIETFGANGDKYLGGENLLMMLAFEIFKDNQEMLRKEGYTFSLAPKCTEFVGSDALLSDSQEAERNMHNLMEVVRPYWENSNEYDDSAVAEDDVTLKVNLFNIKGEYNAGVELATTTTRIYNLFEEKIREGIDNFFNALLLSYENGRVKKPSCINILLAGNSCKSPIVAKIFDEKIAEWTELITKRFGTEFQNQGSSKVFEIFPPLGTDAAYQKMAERGIDCEKDNFEKPTGKTGVAFGLINCRKGSLIERVENEQNDKEIPFQCFIGWQHNKKFEVFKDDENTITQIGKPGYGKWYKFIEADDDTFYIYYTTQPNCVSGDMMVEGNAAVKRLKCEIDVVDENAFVYIRAKDPKTLEYAVSKSNNVDNEKMGEIRTKILEVK